MILSVCIDLVFRGSGYDTDAMLSTVRDTGYRAFEFWSWTNRDIDALERSARRHRLEVGSFCTKMITLLDPAYREAYVDGLRESIEIAKRLNCRHLITQTGSERRDVPRELQSASLVEGLKACAPMLEHEGITLLVEPLNLKVNHPGYFLSASAEAFELIGRVGSSNVKVLYDIYHQQITEGDLTPTIKANLTQIGYFHAADHPGRGEPGTGEIHYPFVFDTIKRLGYRGYVGLEFAPTGNPAEALRRIREQYADGAEPVA